MGKRDTSTINTTTTTAGGKNNPGTETAGKRGRGRPRKDGRPPGGEQPTTTPDVPKLVLVNQPEGTEPEEFEEKEAALPAPKAPKKKRKDIAFELKKEQISTLIKSTFEIAASRPGLELWKLTQKESDMLAEPIAAILNKNPIIERMTGEYGEYFALTVAVCTVIVPRLFIQWAASDKKKKEKIKPYVPINESNRKQAGPGNHTGNKSGEATSSPGQPPGKSAVASQNSSHQFFDVIPAIQ